MKIIRLFWLCILVISVPLMGSRHNFATNGSVAILIDDGGTITYNRAPLHPQELQKLQRPELQPALPVISDQSFSGSWFNPFNWFQRSFLPVEAVRQNKIFRENSSQGQNYIHPQDILEDAGRILELADHGGDDEADWSIVGGPNGRVERTKADGTVYSIHGGLNGRVECTKADGTAYSIHGGLNGRAECTSAYGRTVYSIHGGLKGRVEGKIPLRRQYQRSPERQEEEERRRKSRI